MFGGLSYQPLNISKSIGGMWILQVFFSEKDSESWPYKKGGHFLKE